MASNMSEEDIPMLKMWPIVGLGIEEVARPSFFLRVMCRNDSGRKWPIPQCQHTVTGDKLRLAPFLEKSLRHRQLESRKMAVRSVLWRQHIINRSDLVPGLLVTLVPDLQKRPQEIGNDAHLGRPVQPIESGGHPDRWLLLAPPNPRMPSVSGAMCACATRYEDHMTAPPQCLLCQFSVKEAALKEEDDSTSEWERHRFDERGNSLSNCQQIVIPNAQNLGFQGTDGRGTSYNIEMELYEVGNLSKQSISRNQ